MPRSPEIGRHRVNPPCQERPFGSGTEGGHPNPLDPLCRQGNLSQREPLTPIGPSVPPSRAPEACLSEAPGLSCSVWGERRIGRSVASPPMYSRHCITPFFSAKSRLDCYMSHGGTRKTSSSYASHARLRRCMCTIMPWRTGTIPGGKVRSPLAFSRSHLHARTLAHPHRLSALNMTICACLTDRLLRFDKHAQRDCLHDLRKRFS